MIRITVTGKKGTIARKLGEQLKNETERTGGMPEVHERVLEVSKSHINRCVHLAVPDAEISAQIALLEAPDGGWSVSVLVDASPPPEKAGV